MKLLYGISYYSSDFQLQEEFYLQLKNYNIKNKNRKDMYISHFGHFNDCQTL
jgi:hypothetical protein